MSMHWWSVAEAEAAHTSVAVVAVAVFASQLSTRLRRQVQFP